jgi:hypothetical protein
MTLDPNAVVCSLSLLKYILFTTNLDMLVKQVQRLRSPSVIISCHEAQNFPLLYQVLNTRNAQRVARNSAHTTQQAIYTHICIFAQANKV